MRVKPLFLEPSLLGTFEAEVLVSVGVNTHFFFTGKGLTTAYGDVLIRFLPFRFLFDLTDFVSRAVKID